MRDLPDYEGLRRIGRAMASPKQRTRTKKPMYLPRGLVIDRFPMEATVRLRSTAVKGREHGWTVQDVLDKYGPKWAKFFRKLPTDWILPPPV